MVAAAERSDPGAITTVALSPDAARIALQVRRARSDGRLGTSVLMYIRSDAEIRQVATVELEHRGDVAFLSTRELAIAARQDGDYRIDIPGWPEH